MLIERNLNEIDGIEILKEIRDKCTVPIIMISNKDDEFNKVIGFRLGADDYITHQISPVEFTARIMAHIKNYKRLINHYKKNTKDIIFVKDLKIIKNQRQVYKENKLITLTQKEYDLLLFLAENPDKVFTKDSLFKKIWKMDSIGYIATVTVHIGRLREKIESHPSAPKYIETIWGVGYRFKS
jgi:DNA-binding response OmpR family regulator